MAYESRVRVEAHESPRLSEPEKGESVVTTKLRDEARRWAPGIDDVLERTGLCFAFAFCVHNGESAIAEYEPFRGCRPGGTASNC